MVVVGGAEVSGQLSACLQPDGDNASTAIFKGVRLKPGELFVDTWKTIKTDNSSLEFNHNVLTIPGTVHVSVLVKK